MVESELWMIFLAISPLSERPTQHILMKCHKNNFAEIMGFFHLFGTTYLKKVHTHKIGSLVYQTAEIWAVELQISPY